MIFKIMKLPEHGTVELKQSDDTSRPASLFSMADIYENRVTYRHDGSESLSDTFKFVVTDSTHAQFVVTSELDEDVTTTQPQVGSEVIATVSLSHLDYLIFIT